MYNNNMIHPVQMYDAWSSVQFDFQLLQRRGCTYDIKFVRSHKPFLSQCFLFQLIELPQHVPTEKQCFILFVQQTNSVKRNKWPFFTVSNRVRFVWQRCFWNVLHVLSQTCQLKRWYGCRKITVIIGRVYRNYGLHWRGMPYIL